MKLAPRTTRRLLGSRCSRCGHIAYPAESICNACAHRGESEPIELSPGGILYTFTIVHVAAPGVETPYALGYVDFIEGARVFGRIIPWDNLAVGMRVRVVSGPAGGNRHGDAFWFEPIGESGRDT